MDGQIHRVAASCALAAVFAGCGAGGPPGEPVRLATYDGAGTNCFTNAEPRLLIADPEAGTALSESPPDPVYWPSGYVGRRFGLQVAVFNGSGRLVAMTGRYWYMAANRMSDSDSYRPFYVGCAENGLDEWDPSATPPPG